MKRKKAFTLVELLVVIAILSVLAALLLPSLDESMRQAKRMACSNNLRQIAIGTITYAVDQKDTLPNYPAWKNYIVEANVYGWSSGRDILLNISNDNPNVFYCPMAPFGPKTNSVYQGWYMNPYPCISYSMVGLRNPTDYQISSIYHYGTSAWKLLVQDLPPPAPGQWTNLPNKLGSIDKPSGLAIATDCQDSYNYDGTSGFSYPGDGKWSNSLQSYPNLYPHRTYDGAWEGSTASFFDGHAEYKTFEKLITGTTYPFGVKMRMYAGRGTYENCSYW